MFHAIITLCQQQEKKIYSPKTWLVRNASTANYNIIYGVTYIDIPKPYRTQTLRACEYGANGNVCTWLPMCSSIFSTFRVHMSNWPINNNLRTLPYRRRRTIKWICGSNIVVKNSKHKNMKRLRMDCHDIVKQTAITDAAELRDVNEKHYRTHIDSSNRSNKSGIWQFARCHCVCVCECSVKLIGHSTIG